MTTGPDPASTADCTWLSVAGGTVVDSEGRRGALEHHAAAVVAGAGAEVDDPVGVRHDGLVVLDDHDDRRPASTRRSSRPSSVLDVGEVQARRRLVEDVDAALLAHLRRELEPLALAARQRR